jgi:Bacterial Ig-like domain (group 3)/FG-GAP-like repeat/FG-GAP repeat
LRRQTSTAKKLDLAVANIGSVSVLLGNGNGTFQPAVNYATQYGPTSVAVGDFNGDGKLDLAVSNICMTSSPSCSKGSVSFLFGNGDGTFQPALNHPTVVFAGTLVAGDFNGDGKTDLALESRCADPSCTSGAVVVLLSKGDGSFRSTTYLTANEPNYIAAGDLNGDGRTDLVVAMSECPDNSCTTGLVSVLLGNGDGTFQSPINVSTEQRELSLLIADIDGDGKPDVIAESFSGESSILLGNGDGTLRVSSNLLLPFGHDLVMGDFNADGKPDFAVDGTGVAVLLNVAAGPFHYATAVDLKSSPNPAYVGQTVTLRATVTPAFFAGRPLGDMTFNDNGSPLATRSVSGGKAVFSTSSLDAGIHKLTSSYSGDSKYAPQLSPTLTQTVSLAPTTTMLTSSLNPSLQGQTVIFTATVTSAGPLAPTGKVVFKDGTKTVGFKTLSGGIAVLSEKTLSVGSHSITAVYYGDTASARSATAVLTQIVN